MITISTAFVASDLLTLDDIPDSVRGTNNANDPRLSTLITRVSTAIPRYCGQCFAQQTYVEDVAGFGGVLLRLLVTMLPSGQFAGLYPGGPITTLSSIVKLDTENSTSYTTVTSTDYQISNAMAGFIFRGGGWDATEQVGAGLDYYVIPGSGRPLYRATYTSGFTTPRQGTPGTTVEGTLPYDIRQAAVEAVVSWYHKEQRDTDVVERRMGDVAIRYGQSSGTRDGRPTMGLPETSLDMLDAGGWVRWD